MTSLPFLPTLLLQALRGMVAARRHRAQRRRAADELRSMDGRGLTDLGIGFSEVNAVLAARPALERCAPLAPTVPGNATRGSNDHVDGRWCTT